MKKQTINKIINNLNGMGFSPYCGNTDNNETFIGIGIYDFCSGGFLKGWQWEEIHNCFKSEKCDFYILDIIQNNDAHETNDPTNDKFYRIVPITAKETEDGYSFNFVKQYCKNK